MTIQTPWGIAQHSREIAPGIVSYSTASHGGIKLARERLEQVPKAWRDFASSWSHGWGSAWFEEDCAWAGVAIAFPEHFEAGHVEAARRIARAYGLPDATSAVEQLQLPAIAEA